MKNARSHHVRAKYQLVRMALENPTRFWRTFGPNGDTEYLPKLWQALGATLEPEERVPLDGLTTQASEAPEPPLLTLVLPAPCGRGEAYFLTVAGADRSARVFTLERALLHDGTVGTMLAEFFAHGRANWGAGPAPHIREHERALRELIADPTTSPLTFFELPLVQLGPSPTEH